MKKYNVQVEVRFPATMEVEADSEAEAKARARITQLVPSDLRSLGAIHTKTSVTGIEEA